METVYETSFSAWTLNLKLFSNIYFTKLKERNKDTFFLNQKPMLPDKLRFYPVSETSASQKRQNSFHKITKNKLLPAAI